MNCDCPQSQSKFQREKPENVGKISDFILKINGLRITKPFFNGIFIEAHLEKPENAAKHRELNENIPRFNIQ